MFALALRKTTCRLANLIHKKSDSIPILASGTLCVTNANLSININMLDAVL